jgi:hypothetical protein
VRVAVRALHSNALGPLYTGVKVAKRGILENRKMSLSAFRGGFDASKSIPFETGSFFNHDYDLIKYSATD